MPPASRRLEFGVYLPQVQISFAELRDRVLACEECGIDSVWLMDHLYPPGMPAVPSLEAWTVVSALAPVTSRIRLGHLVLSNSFRHPALLAKMAASLDRISGGRLELGLGSGSYRPEHAMYGIAYESAAARARKLGEALEILKRLFTEERVIFDGEFYRLEDAVSFPKPVQQPNPPIWVGGASERHTLPLVARWADGWNCPTYALADLAARRRVLEAECAKIDRDPSSLRLSAEAVLVLGRDPAELSAALAVAEKRYSGPGWGLHAGGFIGTPERIVTRVRELAAEGIGHFVFFFSDRLSEASLRLFAEEVLPALR